MTMISNKFGVKPEPPWHMPYQTKFGLEHVNFSGKTIDQVFELGVAPGLEILDLVSGGRPHGVLLNSVFWDLSHPDPENLRREHREAWLQSWGRNVTSLMRAVKARYGHYNVYFGWRLGTHMRTANFGSLWNTPYAYALMLSMNDLSRNISRAQGFDVIDSYSESMHLRDSLHPATEPAIAIAEILVSRIQQTRLNVSMATRN